MKYEQKQFKNNETKREVGTNISTVLVLFNTYRMA